MKINIMGMIEIDGIIYIRLISDNNDEILTKDFSNYVESYSENKSDALEGYNGLKYFNDNMINLSCIHAKDIRINELEEVIKSLNMELSIRNEKAT